MHAEKNITQGRISVMGGNLYISRSRKNVEPWKGSKPGFDFLRLTGQQKSTQKINNKKPTQNRGQHKTNQHKTWVVQTMKMAYHLWTTFSPNFWVDVKTLLGFLSVLRPSSVSFLTGKYPIGSWRWAPLLYFLLSTFLWFGSKSFLFISFHLSLIRYAARTRFKHHKFGWSVKLLKTSW